VADGVGTTATDTTVGTPATPGAGQRRLAGRTGLSSAIVSCLAGAALTLGASSAHWVRTAVSDAVAAGGGVVAAPLKVSLGGGDVAPAVGGLGLVGLAAAVALVATRGLGRLVVGVLVAAAGVGVLVYAGRVGIDPGPLVRTSQHVVALAPSGQPKVGAVDVTAAPWVAFVGGLAFLAAGALAVVFGRQWPAMGGRYQTRAARPLDAWDAIERGQDPTETLDTHPPDRA
jgi:hypothetical protein